MILVRASIREQQQFVLLLMERATRGVDRLVEAADVCLERLRLHGEDAML